MKTLRDAEVGSTVKVVKLHGEGALKRHLMDMGITKGCEIYIRKVAPSETPWRSRSGATSLASGKVTRRASRSPDLLPRT